jgi:hypothetical protein
VRGQCLADPGERNGRHVDASREPGPLQFETTTCVYSSSVQQLYTNYSMYFPEEWRRKLVILPAPNAFHDTFFHFEPEAVVATGPLLLPRLRSGSA